jgi:hypothetical protein
LIKGDEPLRITSYAQSWLNKSTDEQTFHLMNAWQTAPKNYKVRLFRKKLIWKLKHDKPLAQKDREFLNGLEALGLVTNGKLTKWGLFFIKGHGALPTAKNTESCLIQDDNFVAPLPTTLDLLWDLEKFLRPRSPGVYPLTKRPLQYLNGDPHGLIALLERGLGKPLPGQLRATLLKQPSIRIAEGIVLEFSSPAELKQLRRQPVFRKYIDEFLSPQRILVSRNKAKGLFRMLKRRGVYVDRDHEQAKSRKKRTHIPYKPTSLMNPVGKNVPKMTIIQKYQQLGQALDILYRTPGYPAEQRRITPLFAEERGEHTYIIAYCQTRRAQRTFRLDRIEVAGTW